MDTIKQSEVKEQLLQLFDSDIVYCADSDSADSVLDITSSSFLVEYTPDRMKQIYERTPNYLQAKLVQDNNYIQIDIVKQPDDSSEDSISRISDLELQTLVQICKEIYTFSTETVGGLDAFIMPIDSNTMGLLLSDKQPIQKINSTKPYDFSLIQTSVHPNLCDLGSIYTFNKCGTKSITSLRKQVLKLHNFPLYCPRSDTHSVYKLYTSSVRGQTLDNLYASFESGSIYTSYKNHFDIITQLPEKILRRPFQSISKHIGSKICNTTDVQRRLHPTQEVTVIDTSKSEEIYAIELENNKSHPVIGYTNAKYPPLKYPIKDNNELYTHSKCICCGQWNAENMNSITIYQQQNGALIPLNCSMCNYCSNNIHKDITQTIDEKNYTHKIVSNII